MYKKGAGIIIFILCLSLSAWGVLNPFGDFGGPSSLDSEEPPSLDLGSDGEDGLNLPPLNPDGTTQDPGDSSGTRGLTGGPSSQGIPDVALPPDPVQDFVDDLEDTLGRTLQPLDPIPLDPIGDIAQYVDPGEDLIENTADDRIHQIMFNPDTGILTDSIYRKVESPVVGWELQLEESRQYRFIPEEVMEEAKSNIPEEQISQAEEEGLLVGNWLATSVEEEAQDLYDSLATVYAAAQTGPEETGLTEDDMPDLLKAVTGRGEGNPQVFEDEDGSWYAYDGNKLYHVDMDGNNIVVDVFHFADGAAPEEIFNALKNNSGELGKNAQYKERYVYEKGSGYVIDYSGNYVKNDRFKLKEYKRWDRVSGVGVDENNNLVDGYKDLDSTRHYTDYQFVEDQDGNFLGFVRKDEEDNEYELIEADGETVKLTVSGDNYRGMLDGIKTPLKESGLISEDTDQAVLSYLLSDRAEISGDTINCKDSNGFLKAILHLDAQKELKSYSYKTDTGVGFWKQGQSQPVTFNWQDLKSKAEKIANELPDLNSLNLSNLRYNFAQNRLIYQNGDTYYYVDYGTDNETINHYGKIVGNSLTAYNDSGEVIENIENKDISGILFSHNLRSIDDFLDKFDINGTTITIDGSAVEEHPVFDPAVRDFAQKVLGLDESKYTGEIVDIEGHTYYIYGNNNNFYAVNVSGDNATVYQYTADNGLQKLSYEKSGNWQQNQQPTTTETLLSKKGVEEVKRIVGKPTVDAALFKDLIGGSENINNNHNFKLTVTDASNNKGTLIVGADENGNFVGAVKQVGDNYTVYTIDGEYSFNKSDLDLGTISQVLINGENDFTVKGSNGAFRVYKERDSNIWRGIGVKGDESSGSLYVWEDLSNFGDKLTIITEALQTIWEGEEVEDLVKKLYIAGKDAIVKQLDESGYYFKVYKLGKTDDIKDDSDFENIFNRVESVIEIDARRLNPNLSAEERAKLPQPSIKIGEVEIRGQDSILKLLGIEDIADVTTEAILELAKNIAYKQSGNQVIVSRDGGYIVWELEQKGSGNDTYYEIKGDGWTITQAQYESLKAKMATEGIPSDLQDLLNPDVSIDIAEKKIVVPVSHPEYGEGYAAKAFKLNDQGVWEVSDDLTPMGRAYQQIQKIASLFQVNVPSWDDFKEGYEGGVIQTEDWKGTNAIIVLDPNTGQVRRILINPQFQQNPQTGQRQYTGAEQEFNLEWSEDGKSATVTGRIGNVDIRNGKLNINDNGSAQLDMEYAVQTQDGRTLHIKKRMEVTAEGIVKEHTMQLISGSSWIKSITSTYTYEKNNDSWTITGKEEVYSSNTDFDTLLEGDYIRYVYGDQEGEGLDRDNIRWKSRHGYEKMGDKTAEWTETSENGDFTQGQITINGQRINRETGEIVPFDNVTVQRIPRSELLTQDANGQVQLTDKAKLYIQAGFFTAEELNSLLRQGLMYMDLLPASDQEVQNYRVTALRAALGSLAPTEQEAQVLLQALMEGGASAAVNKLAEMLAQQYGAQAAQQYLQRQGDDGKTLQQKLSEVFSALKHQFDTLGNNLKMALYDYSGALLKIAEATPGEPKEGSQSGRQQQPRGGARAGGGAAPGGAGGRQGQPGQGGAQMPPGGWTPYGGRDIPQIAQNRLFDPEKGIFGTDDPVERINRIYNRYPEVINQWANAMGMTPEEWMNKFRSLTRDDARRRWLKQQNIRATAQKLRTAYLKGLGLNDEQVSKVMSMLGDKEACINYLMQVLGISREEAEAIYNMLMSLGTEDGIRKYLEKLGYTEEEINAFIEKLNKMKEEKKQYLKELGLSDDEIEEILGMSKEEAEAKLKELGLTDEEIADYFAKEEEIRQYLKEEMGIEDEAEIDQILILTEEEARTYLENRSLDIDIDEFLALETDEEKLEYLKNYFMNEKGMSEEEAAQRAQEIMDKLSEIGDTNSNQPDVEALQKYFNEHDININLDEFLALGSEEEMLNCLKDYFLNNEDLSEEEAQARAEEVMNDISDMLGGAQGIEDKILEMYNYLEENNYNTDEFLKELGFDNDKILEFKRLTEDHARYWFLTDTFENLIAQKNPDMSEEEVKEKAEWLAGLILGKEVKEDMRLVPVSPRERLREILSAWEDAAKELGLDKAGINDRLRQAAGQVQPGQPGQTPQQPGANPAQVGGQVVTQPGQQGQPQGNTRVVQPQPAANRPSDEEIEKKLREIGDDLIVSLLTGEMFPENAREVALNIMREHMQDFNWNGNGRGGDNDNRPPIGINPPVQPVPMPERWNWTQHQNRAPWEVEGVGMNDWFERYRNQFQTPQEFTAWTQAWRNAFENALQRASALHTQNVQQILRRGTLVTRPGRGF